MNVRSPSASFIGSGSHRLWAMAFLLTLSASAANAQSALYWSGNGTTLGGAGTWNTTDARWGTSPAGPFSGVWSNAANATATFNSLNTGAVTLGTGITVGGLNIYATSGYVINNGANTLTFGAANNTVQMSGTSGSTSSSAAITGNVAGTGNLTFRNLNPVATSTLTLNGTSTGGWSGSTTFNSGFTANLAQSNQALLNTSGITLNGGSITLTNTTPTEAAVNKVSNSAPITSRGGTFTFTNTSGTTVYAETIGSVELVRGQTNFVLTTNQAGTGSQTLTLSGLTRTGATNTSAVTFSSGGGLNDTKNMLVVTGAPATAAGQIIGPWATVGTATGTQTDYAIFNASSQVVARATGATGEDTWTSGSNVTLSGGTSLTGTRTLNSLRYIGAAGALDLGTHDLQTFGVLNGSGNLLTISTAGSGVLTTAAGGGQIYLTAGSTGGSITVSAPIADNSGNVEVVKSGVGTLTLSGTNTYSGGTVLNAGTLSIGNVDNVGGAAATITFGGTATLTNTAALNFSSGTLTMNEGAVGTITIGASGTQSFATTTGTGTLVYSTGSNNRILNLGNASTFNGTLQVKLNNNANYGTGNTLQFASLGDGVGSSIQFGGGTGDSNQAVTVTFNGAAPLIFNNRAIEIIPRAGGNWNIRDNIIANNSAGTANTWTINTNLINNMDRNGNFVLGGSNAGNNTFAGSIGDSTFGSLRTGPPESNYSGVGALSIQKTGAGTWILSGNNTYTGSTTIASSGGTLVGIGANAFGSTSGITMSSVTLSLRGDSSTTFVRASDSTPYTITTTASGATINATSATGDTTAKTMSIGSIGTSSTAATYQVNFSGTDNTSLSVGAITGSASTATANVTINNTISGTGVLTIGSYTSANTNGGETLVFSSAGNTFVNGAITPSSTVLGITKSNQANSVTLNGTNTFTGGITVSGGTLAIAGSGSLGAGNYSGNISIASPNSGRLVYSSSAAQTLGGTISGAGALFKDGLSILTLTGDNGYSGATAINAGTLEIGGSGSINSTSSITVAAGARLAYNSSVGLTVAPALNGSLGNRAVLGGTGSINVAVTLDSLDDVLSPGNSPGIQNYGVSQSWGSYTYEWELNDWNGVTAGTNFDQLSITGTLTGGPGSYALDIVSLTALNDPGNVPNFAETNRTWTILTTSAGISGFDANNWIINAGGFSSTPVAAGTWNVAQSGNSLILNYVAVPEPATLALAACGLVGVGLAARRRFRLGH